LADQLLAKRCRLPDLPRLGGAGVYIFCLSPDAILPAIMPAASNLLYVGMTDQSLELRNHFLHRDSGRSTLRRSLGSLLVETLGLRAVPRGSQVSERDATNYCFADDGEEKLSAWMAANLLGAQYELDCDVRGAEKALIAALRPPLNLTDWPNPQKPIVSAARERCRARARMLLAPR